MESTAQHRGEQTFVPGTQSLARDQRPSWEDRLEVQAGLYDNGKETLGGGQLCFNVLRSVTLARLVLMAH